MDNLDYTKIQAVFDPCSVVIAEDGVTLIFHPDKVQVSSLEIRENIQHNVREFKDLVSHAEKIRITLDPDGKGELQFCFPIPGAGTLLISPLEHMETPEELRRELMKALSRLKPVSALLFIQWKRSNPGRICRKKQSFLLKSGRTLS